MNHKTILDPAGIEQKINKRVSVIMVRYSGAPSERTDWEMGLKTSMEWLMHWTALTEESWNDLAAYISCALLLDRPWLADKTLHPITAHRIYGETFGDIAARIAGDDSQAASILTEGMDACYAAACQRHEALKAIESINPLAEQHAYERYMNLKALDGGGLHVLYALLAAGGVPSTDWDPGYLDKVMQACTLTHDMLALARHAHEKEKMNLFRLGGRTDAETLKSAFAQVLSLQYDVMSDSRVPQKMRDVCLQYVTGHVSSHLWMARYGLRSLVTNALSGVQSAKFEDSGNTSHYRVGSSSLPSQQGEENAEPQHVGSFPRDSAQARHTIENADLCVDDQPPGQRVDSSAAEPRH
ncbi:hypothetical protein [Streptomyces monomycini]|uniref:hypothetical protein n=1 Tax=Streptomyces monomycini TaxID=371720 RepID=UPI0004AB0214|nr:hypothetical protein [Streptomyces monomycini]